MPKEEKMSQAVQEIEKLRDLIVDCARRARRDGIISLRELKTDRCFRAYSTRYTSISALTTRRLRRKRPEGTQLTVQ